MTDTEDMESVELARPGEVFVPAHPRIRNGRREWVDAHWRKRADVLREVVNASGRERAALMRALGKRSEDPVGDDDVDAPSTEFGMKWDPNGPKRREVREAKTFRGWDTLPLTEVDLETTDLYATEERVVSRTVNRLTDVKKLREGYDVQLVKASDGRLYIADGHHRVAVMKTRGDKVMKVKVLDLSSAGVAARKFEKAGGFSLRPNGQEPETGFMVAHPGTEEDFDVREMTFRRLKEYMERHKDVLQSSNVYFGGWLDRKTNRVYLDISRNVESEAEARKLGSDWGQLAVFDIEKAKQGEDGTVYLAADESNEVAFLDGTDVDRAWDQLTALIEGRQ